MQIGDGSLTLHVDVRSGGTGLEERFVRRGQRWLAGHGQHRDVIQHLRRREQQEQEGAAAGAGAAAAAAAAAGSSSSRKQEQQGARGGGSRSRSRSREEQVAPAHHPLGQSRDMIWHMALTQGSAQRRFSTKGRSHAALLCEHTEAVGAGVSLRAACFTALACCSTAFHCLFHCPSWCFTAFHCSSLLLAEGQ